MRRLGEDTTERNQPGEDELRREPVAKNDPEHRRVEVSRVEPPAEAASAEPSTADEPVERPARTSPPLAPHEAFPPHLYRSVPAGAPAVHVQRIERPTDWPLPEDEPAPVRDAIRATPVSAPAPPAPVETGVQPLPVVPEPDALFEHARRAQPEAPAPESAIPAEATEPAPIQPLPELPPRFQPEPVPTMAAPVRPEARIAPASVEPAPRHIPAAEPPLPAPEPPAVSAGGRWEEFAEGQDAQGQLRPMAFPPLTHGVVRDIDEEESRERPLLKAIGVMLFLLAALGALGWGGWWIWLHRAELTNRASQPVAQPETTVNPPAPSPSTPPQAAKPAQPPPAAPSLQGTSNPPAATQNEASRKPHRSAEDENYHPEIVPPYPTLPSKAATTSGQQPASVAPAQPAAPVPSQAAPQTSNRQPLGIPRPSAPVLTQRRSDQESGAASAPSSAPPAYAASPDGTYMSPLAQNIVAVQALQRQSTVPLREFHARVGAVATAASGVTLTMQSLNAASGNYALLVTSGGSSYPLRGRLNNPLYFSDSATHTAYELVILKIAGDEAYGYVQPPQ